MKSYPKISIVTPNLNGDKHLEYTIQSVIKQNYPNLEYIVIDGGSTDGSIEIIRKYEKHITYWESAPDKGLYHAIQKGFEKSTGEIMGWVNSDDIHLPNSLFTLSELFSVNNEIHWIQGYPVVIDDHNRIVFHRPAVNSKFSFYLKDYQGGSFIQQESTFWTRKLWEKAGGYISTEYKFAGDFELWMRFFNHSSMYLTEAMLGAFRIRHEGQISMMNYKDYLRECNQIIDACLMKLPVKETQFLKNVTLFRKFNAQLPGIFAAFQVNYFEKKIAPSQPMLKFDFAKYAFKLKS
ncbi:MAG: glycosyltransferase family 2 protein [Bacteroidetes bacterium]|nr:glycosyltransferase family 2 protein [Bacteroidota bacterium]